MSFRESLRRAVNAFVQDEKEHENLDFSNPTQYTSLASYGHRPDRVQFRFSNERSIITSIYTRISIDIASIVLKHCRLDDLDRYSEDIQSGLNNCLTVEANLDQASRAFRQDIAMTLCDEGVAAIVPVDTTLNPKLTGSYDILTMRVGKITKWMPDKVTVELYNELKGKRQEITLPKSIVAIVENPLYAVMNEPNSTLQRLIHKLTLLDAVDEASASGKLDLIIQLPYVIKTEQKRQQAEQRREDIEFQLKGSQYGIAYTDGTEKITQLNRPAENNLMAQIEYLLAMLYGQLGITAEVMNGTADEKAMLNYWNRTIEPMTDAIVEEMKRKFLTKTARSQKQSIEYFRDPFRLVPIASIAEIADKFARNEITSSNEIRSFIGLRPSQDPKADQLVNSNMPQGEQPALTDGTAEEDPSADPAADPTADDGSSEVESIMNSAFDELDAEMTGIFGDLGVDENAIDA